MEPVLASDAKESIRTGVIQPMPLPVRTIADGLRTKLETNTFAVIHKGIEDILLVEDEEIIEATLLIWKRMKILVETSSAIVLAGVLKHKELFANKKLGLIISGGNADLDVLKTFL